MQVGHEINDQWTISVPESVLFQQLGDVEGEFVLLDMQSGGYFGLNEVASRIWGLIQARNSIGQILSALIQEYEAPQEALRDDLQQFITELDARSLIRIDESNGG